jgi:hypothetical protein
MRKRLILESFVGTIAYKNNLDTLIAVIMDMTTPKKNTVAKPMTTDVLPRK